ncbi:hypothetical protein N9251_02820 [Gammaproteobacteria bacterium]|nr:hypothetical protein [Gammaproteobacteria bacterium]
MKRKNTSVIVELHYAFEDDNKHDINALVKNKAEKNFIEACSKLNRLFKIPVDVMALPSQKGSFISLFRMTYKYSHLLNKVEEKSVFSSIVALYAYVLAPNHARLTQQLVQEKVCVSDLDSAIMQLKPKANTLKLQNVSKDTEFKQSVDVKDIDAKGVELTAETSHLDSIVAKIAKDKGFVNSRSGFFRELSRDKSILSIECKCFVESRVSLKDTFKVLRKDFTDYMVKRQPENSVDSKVDVLVHIVSPVLDDNNVASWKGRFQDRLIDFRMADTSFLKQVASNQVSFMASSLIHCNMIVEVKRTYEDDVLESERTVYTVDYVKKYGQQDNMLVTQRYKESEQNSQMTLAFD